MTTFDAPIILIGAGRSGSTLFHQLLGKHPEVAYLSNLCTHFPQLPILNKGLMYGLTINPQLADKFIADEAYAFWDKIAEGLSTSTHDLESDFYTLKQYQHIRKSLNYFTTNRKHRLLIKITGWTRIPFFKTLFPNAKFVHLVRDGRAVAASLLEIDWWKGWDGPENWRWGKLSTEQEAQWELTGKSPQALAAIQWNIILDAFHKTNNLIQSENLMEIRYEDFTENPIEIMQQFLHFTQLRKEEKFSKELAKKDIHSTNNKWRKKLSQEDQTNMTNIQKKWLKHYNYL